MHLFRYVRPSVPHTGSFSLPHLCSHLEPDDLWHRLESGDNLIPVMENFKVIVQIFSVLPDYACKKYGANERNRRGEFRGKEF